MLSVMQQDMAQQPATRKTRDPVREDNRPERPAGPRRARDPGPPAAAALPELRMHRPGSAHAVYRLLEQAQPAGAAAVRLLRAPLRARATARHPLRRLSRQAPALAESARRPCL